MTKYHRYVPSLPKVMGHGDGSAAMLAAKRSAGVAPEVNFMEYVTCMPPPSMNKAETLALKPRGDITRSPKQGYQWPTKRTHVLQKILKKEKKVMGHKATIKH